MTVTVELVEAKNGLVHKLSKLCSVSGKIPVYVDEGRPASFNGGEIPGCTMLWKGQTLRLLTWVLCLKDPSHFVLTYADRNR
jgi:hypothetical protein